MTTSLSLITHHSVLFIKGAVLLVAFALSALFACSPWGKHLELLCYDGLFLLRGARPPSQQVVVVAIDEPSFGVLKQKWPWPRNRHAEFLDTLFHEGARAVAIDVLFAEPSDAEGDRQLSEVVRSHPGTILAAALEVVDDPVYRYSTAVFPLRTLITESTRIGIINLPLDMDGFVRRGFLAYGSMPSISLAAVEAFFSEKGDELQRDFSTAAGEVMINYAGPPRTVSTVSYYQAMNPARYLPKDFFKGKLVFVGLSLHTTPEVDTPFSDHFLFPYSRQGGNILSGVEIQATLAGNLLDGNTIRLLPRHILWSCFLWVIGFGMLVFLCPGLGFPSTCVLSGVSMLSVYLLFRYRCIYFPPVFAIFPVCVGCLALPFPHLLHLRRDKKYIRDVFSKYVSPKVVRRLLEDTKQLHLGGHLVDASVLYLDIAGFSRMAVNMIPDRLVSELSRYLGRFTETIFKWDGMVDKYVGDAIMAIWGVPLPQEDHAVRACRAALEMRRDLDMLLSESPMASETAMDIRIGINTGEMLAGNVGGRHFLNYTVHGDATNFAVRLEALNKQYGTHILVGQGTAARIGDEFITREIDLIRMEGRPSNVALYELMGVSGDMDIQLRQRIRMFETARRLYLNRAFEAAGREFAQILSQDDTDGPSRVYMERCLRYQQAPPPETWDGVTDIRLK